MVLKTFSTRDIALLRGFLRDDAARACYLLGDLAPAYFGYCKWFVATTRARPIAVLLCFEGLGEPVLLSHGAPDGAAALLERFGPELASSCWAKIPLSHREGFERVFELTATQRLWTMELAEFHPFDAPGVVRLTEANLPDMLSLYESEPENWFAASQMCSAVYFGRYRDGQLLSAAGTHAYSPGEHVAVLGNIVTAAEARNRGHARAVTSRLIEELRRCGCNTITLQVAEANMPAVAAYRRLGFVFRDVVLQSRCQRCGSSHKVQAQHSKGGG